MLVLDDVRVVYPDFEVRYDLTVPAGALCALIGPSGGGKTTLLHTIAGFASVASGTIEFDIERGLIRSRKFVTNETVLNAFGQQTLLQVSGESTENKNEA